jgi:hypothetical protein
MFRTSSFKQLPSLLSWAERRLKSC